MTLFSPALVEEIYKLTQRQLEQEDRRESAFLTKAGPLLGQTGLATSVAGLFLGLILKESGGIEHLSIGWRLVLAFAYLCVFGCGTASAWYALKVVLVRGDFQEVDEDTVFNSSELSTADEPLAMCQPQVQTSASAITRNPDADATAVTRYRRWLIPQLWGIYQRHNEIHEEKAALLRRAQQCFWAFVMGIALAIPLVSYALLTLTPNHQMDKVNSTSATPATPDALTQVALPHVPTPSRLEPNPISSPVPGPQATGPVPETASEPATAAARPQPSPTGIPPAGRLMQGTAAFPDSVELNMATGRH